MVVPIRLTAAVESRGLGNSQNTIVSTHACVHACYVHIHEEVNTSKHEM